MEFEYTEFAKKIITITTTILLLLIIKEKQYKKRNNAASLLRNENWERGVVRWLGIYTKVARTGDKIPIIYISFNVFAPLASLYNGFPF